MRAEVSMPWSPAHTDWVSTPHAPQMAQRAADHGLLQSSLFDERNLPKLTSKHFPGA